MFTVQVVIYSGVDNLHAYGSMVVDTEMAAQGTGPSSSAGSALTAQGQA
jgi:hypothetical protein